MYQHQRTHGQGCSTLGDSRNCDNFYFNMQVCMATTCAVYELNLGAQEHIHSLAEVTIKFSPAEVKKLGHSDSVSVHNPIGSLIIGYFRKLPHLRLTRALFSNELPQSERRSCVFPRNTNRQHTHRVLLLGRYNRWRYFIRFSDKKSITPRLVAATQSPHLMMTLTEISQGG